MLGGALLDSVQRCKNQRVNLWGHDETWTKAERIWKVGWGNKPLEESKDSAAWVVTALIWGFALVGWPFGLCKNEQDFEGKSNFFSKIACLKTHPNASAKASKAEPPCCNIPSGCPVPEKINPLQAVRIIYLHMYNIYRSEKVRTFCRTGKGAFKNQCPRRTISLRPCRAPISSRIARSPGAAMPFTMILKGAQDFTQIKFASFRTPNGHPNHSPSCNWVLICHFILGSDPLPRYNLR